MKSLQVPGVLRKNYEEKGLKESSGVVILLQGTVAEPTVICEKHKYSITK